MPDVKPWHDAPPCPKCTLTCVVPFYDSRDNDAPSRLRCAACGHDWVESNVAIIAKAWWSMGAWDAHEEIDKSRKEAGHAG